MEESQKPANPHAFPTSTSSYTPQHGMSLRDYFAAQAIPALITNFTSHGQTITLAELIANSAYEIADEMLKEREKISK
jgi:hypothetical protein